MNDNIPALIPGAVGWPWSMVTSAYPETMPNGQPWPKITIVTPSFNQAQFLEETIRSVLMQGYPNLEYLVMDGGSTDGSREIIEYYAPYLTYWRSKKDNGQSAAIMEGFEKSTGEILGWLNSDDLLLPDSLAQVAQYFMHHAESECLVGGSIVIDQDGKLMKDRMGLPRILRGGKRSLKHLLLVDCGFYQPASFWRREAYFDVGGLDPNFTFTMDYDLYLKFAERRPLDHLDELLACFRFHPESKTTTLADVRHEESLILWKRYKRDEMPHSYCTLYKIAKSISGRLFNLPVRVAIKLGIIHLPYAGTG